MTLSGPIKMIQIAKEKCRFKSGVTNIYVATWAILFTTVIEIILLKRRHRPNLRNMKQSSIAWNSLPQNVQECSEFHFGSILEMSWKSVYVFSRNVASRQTNKQTNKQTKRQNLAHLQNITINIWNLIFGCTSPAYEELFRT